MSEYYLLLKLLKEHLKLEVHEHFKNEMEAIIKFDDTVITKAKWKK